MQSESTLFGTATVTHDPGGKSKPPWPVGSVVTAEFSPCGRYRYRLSEVWDGSRPAVAWLMMNPSVAGIEHADPTLIRTGGFARAWGYGGQLVINAHAYRITDSRRLADVADPVGPDNDAAIMLAAMAAELVILAYGQPPRPLRPRADRVVRSLVDAGVRLAYLRLSKNGTPWHPLYLPAALKPIPWVPQPEVQHA